MDLPACHAIDVVVEEDDRQIDVAPAAVQEMIASDGSAVTVSCDDDDVQFGACKLDPCCKGNGSPVRRVYGIKVHIAGTARGAADAGDDDGIVLRHALRALDRLRDAFQRRTVAAARTPQVGQAVLSKILLKAAIYFCMRIHIGAHPNPPRSCAEFPPQSPAA